MSLRRSALSAVSEGTPGEVLAQGGQPLDLGVEGGEPVTDDPEFGGGGAGFAGAAARWWVLLEQMEAVRGAAQVLGGESEVSGSINR